MYLFNVAYCFQVFIFFYCFVGASGFSVVAPFIMDGDLPPPQLSQVKDSRDDGISYEANRAMLKLHLKDTYPGKNLEDFSLPGTQRFKLSTSKKRKEKDSPLSCRNQPQDQLLA
jgi:hypothetical protein